MKANDLELRRRMKEVRGLAQGHGLTSDEADQHIEIMYQLILRVTEMSGYSPKQAAEFVTKFIPVAAAELAVYGQLGLSEMTRATAYWIDGFAQALAAATDEAELKPKKKKKKRAKR